MLCASSENTEQDRDRSHPHRAYSLAMETHNGVVKGKVRWLWECAAQGASLT